MNVSPFQSTASRATVRPAGAAPQPQELWTALGVAAFFALMIYLNRDETDEERAAYARMRKRRG